MLKSVLKIVSILLLAVIFFDVVLVDSKALETSAEAMVLINADTLEVLDSKNSDKRLPMASTTKLMTALIIAQNCDLKKEIVTTKEMVTVEGSSMGLLEGDRVSYYALLVGMLLASGNDAANTAAIAFAGSISEFADVMNEKAKEIGMENTNFVTPSGLHDDEHYSTAYDMALLACEILKNDTLRQIVSCEKMTVTYGNPPYKRTLSNHNKLLSSYEYAIGLKTGYTKKAGRCLVSAATNNGCTVVAVTLNDPDDWDDHQQLLEYGFSKLTPQTVIFDGSQVEIPVVGASVDAVLIDTTEFVFGKSNGRQENITYNVFYEPFLYAPVSCGQVVGRIDFYCNENFLKSLPLCSKEEILLVENKPLSEFSEWLFNIYLLIANCL